jgi:hypothetical protein
MKDRRTLVAVWAVVFACVAFATAYLTLFTFGDPFSGTWRLNPDDPYAVVIKLIRGGYFVAVANGQTSSGWFPGRRSGTVLTSTVKGLEHGVPSSTTLVFESSDGHLVETDHNLNLLLTKTSGSTTIPPPQGPAMSWLRPTHADDPSRNYTTRFLLGVHPTAA